VFDLFGALFFVVALAPEPKIPVEYQEAWATIPLRYRQLVTRVDLADHPGRAYRAELRVEVPRKVRASALVHEVMHVAMYATPELERGWERTFWRDSRPLGWPQSKYGATNYREDFAEAAEELHENGCLNEPLNAVPSREAFLRERVFRAEELPTLPFGPCRR